MTEVGTRPLEAREQSVETDAVPVDLAALSRPHLSPVLGRYFERSWSHGDGHLLFDTAGRSYLDFACGIATTGLGHRHPRVTAAIHEQVDRLVHVSGGLGYLEPVGRLAELIADALPDPLDTVIFGNSGSEAIEAALKFCRRVTGRPGIIAFSGAFHGRTYGALTITSSSVNYRTGYEPLVPSVYLSRFPNIYRDFAGDEKAATEGALRDLRRVLADEIPPQSVAAIFIEPIQGEGGYNPAPLAFLQALREICDQHGILLVADEVQSGFGRTGKWWGFEHAGIVPDVVCLAKAIANGLPLGAMVSRRELHDRWGLGSHGSTFGGNPVSCAAGVAVVETIRDEELVANAAERGKELIEGLRGIADESRIGDVRGRGLMVGVEFVRDRDTREPDGATADQVIARCADEGLILLTCGTWHQVVRWMPPLDVSSEEIRGAVATFKGVLSALPREAAAEPPAETSSP